jgi:hypothetical protein
MFTATRLTVSFGQLRGNVTAEASEDIEDIEDQDEEVDEVEEDDFLDERRVYERTSGNGAVSDPSGAQVEEEMWKEEEEEEEEEAGDADIIVSTVGTGIVSAEGEGEGEYGDEFEEVSGGEEVVE